MTNTINKPIIKIINNNSIPDLKLFETYSASRFGSIHDGGYILTDEIVLISDYLISGGIGLNVEFENDVMQLNKQLKSILIDASISKIKFIFRPLKYLFSNLFFYYCENTFRFFHVISISFFEKKYLNNKNNISYFLNKYNLTKSKGILKLDIEGSEWLILNDIIKNSSSFNAICIEFHNVNSNIHLLNNFIADLKTNDFNILSYSVNNAIYFNCDSDVPDIIEISFVLNRFLIDSKILQRRSNDTSNIIFNF